MFRLVEASPGAGGQPLGKAADCGVIGEAQRGADQPSATVEPHLAGAVDEHVRDQRIGEKWLQDTKSGQLGPECGDDFEQRHVAEDAALFTQGRRDPSGSRLRRG